MPFFTAKGKINGSIKDLFYFHTAADAASFQKTHGGEIRETSLNIWRVAA